MTPCVLKQPGELPDTPEKKPGHSCKDIRDSGYFQKDGEYWIDPEKNGGSSKVFCDMTTDGGKHC